MQNQCRNWSSDTFIIFTCFAMHLSVWYILEPPFRNESFSFSELGLVMSSPWAFQNILQNYCQNATNILAQRDSYTSHIALEWEVFLRGYEFS